MQIREGIKHAILRHELGIDKVLLASNGTEAFEIFCKHSPEIVLTDIRMPGMDGLELFKKIQEVNSDVKVIILSAYSDFPYLKKALQYGAVDYELKPVKEKVLINLIKCAIEDLVKNKNFINEMEKLKESYKREFIKDLFNNRINGPEKISEGFSKYFDISLKGYYLCIVLDIDAYYQCSDKNNDEQKAISSLIVDYITNHPLNASKSLVIEFNEKQTVFLCRTNYTGHQDNNLRQKINVFLNELNSTLISEFGVSVSAGISNPGSLTNMYNLYCQSVSALKGRLYNGRSSLNYYNKIHKTKRYDLMNAIDEQEMELYIKSFNIDVVCSKIENIFKDLKRNKCCDRSYLISLCIRLLHTLTRVLKSEAKKPINLLPKEQVNDPIELTEYDTIDEYRNMVVEIYKHTLLSLKELKGINNPTIIKAIEFIHTNYDSDFSVKELSDHVNITPNYLSHIFKKEVGMSFSEYRNKIRVKKAKKLIENTVLPISVISEKVGFFDYSYFCYLFKKFEGITPSQLRKSYAN